MFTESSMECRHIKTTLLFTTFTKFMMGFKSSKIIAFSNFTLQIRRHHAQKVNKMASWDTISSMRAITHNRKSIHCRLIFVLYYYRSRQLVVRTNYGNTKTICEICRSGVFNFEHSSHLVPGFQLLTLNM